MIQIVGTILLIALLSLTAVSQDVIKVGNFGPNDVFQLLTVIGFVAALQHSAVEVIMSTWRDPIQEKYKADMERLDAELAVEDETPEERKQWILERKDIEIKIKEFKTVTRKLALWITLLSGVFVSVVGIRILGNLIDPSQLKEMSKYQSLGFNIMDVFLTGALISGGTEGVYQIVQVFSSFLNKTTEKVKAN
ncbi:hypothetical protein [Spirulina sp. 06S082]|uniref:hypothetical protein n=1 Tax=Spirulina sp. 06S082 TaxID=3110248 RepID=UPI002B21F706|nr:hypothetical protein [Spirulina sp. 06S082]MEA5471837.1 hypothetical protein [Spirulina sp. 06S082]